MSENLPITTPADLRAWEARMKVERNWGRMKCIRALDLSYDRFMRLRNGRWIPAHVGLAMSALTVGLQPYKQPE